MLVQILSVNFKIIIKNLLQMIAEDDDNNLNYGNMAEEQIDPNINYNHVTKYPYVDKIFCWIESGQTEKIISFFNTFPHLLNQFHSPNNWNPFMYAVRYGNMELIQYFRQKGMTIHTNGVLHSLSIVHTAVYSGDVQVLRYVLKDKKSPPNPINCEVSPLKIAMKASNPKMVELLVSRGAYYVFGDVMNNIDYKSSGGSCDDNYKYVSVLTGKEVHNTSVVQDVTIKDCAIKQTLRMARVKQVFHLQKHAKMAIQRDISPDDKFYGMAHILSNQSYVLEILKACVYKGSSLLTKVEPMEMDGKK